MHFCWVQYLNTCQSSLIALRRLQCSCRQSSFLPVGCVQCVCLYLDYLGRFRSFRLSPMGNTLHPWGWNLAWSSWLLRANFTPSLQGLGVGPQMENFTEFWNINTTHRCIPCAIVQNFTTLWFSQNFQSLWAVLLWVNHLNLGDSLNGFCSYGGLTSGWIFLRFSVPQQQNTSVWWQFFALQGWQFITCLLYTSDAADE